MDIPEVLFAPTHDGLNIAYQQFGEGPDFLFVPGLISNVEISWEHELFRRAMLHTADHVRMVQFDKRGIGCSDRYREQPTLDVHIRDILAVLDAAGIEKALVSGVSEGGLMATQFAIRHPERVERLVIANSAPGSGRMLEFGDQLESVVSFLSGLPESWGRDGQSMVDWFVASQRENDEFLRWMTRYARQSGSRDDITRQIENLYALDTPDYSRVTVPTLVIASTGDPLIPTSVSRRTAELIPGAGYAEVETPDHFFFAGSSWREYIDLTLEFLLERPLRKPSTRAFATVLFTDLVGSTTQTSAAGDTSWHTTIDGHNRIVREIVKDGGGTHVKSTGDGLLATFPTPSQALAAATRLHASVASIGLRIRAGLHAGEIEVHDDGDISGLAVNLAARVEQAAEDGTTFVSSTVRDLLLGGERRFEGRGEHKLKGLDGAWMLYELVD